jgi:hypothetical protein
MIDKIIALIPLFGVITKYYSGEITPLFILYHMITTGIISALIINSFL